MKAKVSVIIPVYGVEQYIERCIKSLLEQTLDNIEYIIVNDCTPDDSMSIFKRVLEDYPHRKKQVKIVCQPYNMGTAKAREVGIKAANGDYIIHCDSDDWVEKDAYSLMYHCAIEHGYDIVISKYRETDGKNELNVVDQQLGQFPLRTVIKKPVLCSLYNKLVKRSIFTNNVIYYPVCHMMEDNALCVQMFYYAQKVGYLEHNQPLYNYYINPNSICHTDSEQSHLKRWADATKNVQTVCQFAKDMGVYKTYANEFLSLKANTRGFLMPLMRHNNKHYKKWINTFPELNWYYLFAKDTPLTLKLVFVLTEMGVYPAITKLKIKTV